MIFVMDGEGRCVLKGEEWTRLTGQPLAEAAGHGWVVRVHPEDRAIVSRTVEQAIASISEFSVRFRVLQPDEQPCWVAAGGIPAVGPPDAPFLGYLGSLTRLADVTAEAMTAYGNIGRFVPPPAHDATSSTDRLDRIADHLILAHALVEEDGATTALIGIRQALFEVGRALAARQHPTPTLN